MPEHILSLSYGKDSLACLGAIEQLGWPLDRIVHAEVWATDMIPADLPPMVEFKQGADRLIKERWGIEVEHIFATKKDGKKKTYDSCFYTSYWHKTKCKIKATRQNGVYGFPSRGKLWCNSLLKVAAINKTGGKNTVRYLGIAADEPNRFHNLSNNKRSPLVEAGWTEADCRKWCEENRLLSPIYTSTARGGCWFCHNQGVNQLRILRHNYPELWALMLMWDRDSPITFKADGHTVYEFDRRFELEDMGLLSPDDKVFRWAMLDDELNYRMEEFR